MSEITGIRHKSEQDELSTQIALVQHVVGKQFRVFEEDKFYFDMLTDHFSHGLEYRDNTVLFPWAQYEINFKEKYPEQYQKYLTELRRARALQQAAFQEFLDPEKTQHYPIFIPVWHDKLEEYNYHTKNDFWEHNTDQNYFLKHTLQPKHLSAISPTANVFYSHCATGLGVEAFARAMPRTTITAGDINENVWKKCKAHLAQKSVQNVVRYVTSPAEYLPFGANQFDAVYTHEAIWVNPYRAFREYVKIVKPGGVIVGSTGSKSHDTSIFFKLYGDVYNAQPTITHDKDFTVVSVPVANQMKKDIETDAAVLDVLYGYLTPDGDKSFAFPATFYKNFIAHDLNKTTILKALKELGLSKVDLGNSLRRLSKVAKDLYMTTESSYNAVAVQLS